MKNFIWILVTMSSLLIGEKLMSQNYVALHQQNGILHFSGSQGLRAAYAAANSGDTIYLPGGNFSAPDTILKTVYVLGAGHYPSQTVASQVTYVTGIMKLGLGANNSYFEGIYFFNNIEFLTNIPVSNVSFRRCRLEGNIFVGGTRVTPSVGIKFMQCLLTSESWFDLSNAIDMVFSNCIFRIYGFSSMQYALVANNVFFRSGGWLMNGCDNNIYRNNIIRNGFFWTGSGNLIQNNVFFYNQGNAGSNVWQSNYVNVDLTDFFVSFDQGEVFNYSYDFHLQNPGSYLGTDGQQVGIYGGLYPYKDGAVPFIPHVISKYISPSIDANGNIQVEIEVSAQEE